jgi:hypothetical protein
LAPDLTQTIETLRTIKLHINQRCIVKDVRYKLDSIYETTLELDSHANTCVLGRNALIILDYNRPVSVVGYNKSLETKTYQTVSGYEKQENVIRDYPGNIIRDAAMRRPKLILN